VVKEEEEAGGCVMRIFNWEARDGAEGMAWAWPGPRDQVLDATQPRTMTGMTEALGPSFWMIEHL
jgi:hypothetical protein